MYEAWCRHCGTKMAGSEMFPLTDDRQAPRPTTITERVHGAVTVLDIDGPFTFGRGAEEFRDTICTLLEQGRTQVLVNMGGNDLDGRGLDVLVRAYVAATRRGGTLKLVNLSRKIGPGLPVITKLLVAFEMYKDEAEALASFASARS